MDNMNNKWIFRNAVKAIPFSLQVIYFGKLIALVNDMGKIVWRDTRYPVFLIDYLIANPLPTADQVRIN
jgi:hypothetical protein